MTDTIRKSLLYAMACLASGLLFANVYTSLIDAVNWGRDIPASILATREYFNPKNPGDFFRVFSPLNQVLALLVLLFCWKEGGKVRLYSVLTLVTAVSLDLFTFAYFFPRNDIMFVQPVEGNIDAIRNAWSEWTAMNWVRSGLNVANVVLDFALLTLVLRGGRETRRPIP
jgi:hypothetical protein